MQATRYRLPRGDGRSTEALVEAGAYGYAHSCVTSENFPSRSAPGGADVVDLVLLGLEGFDDSWGPRYRFAFVAGPEAARGTR